jgi:hypothetical protein
VIERIRSSQVSSQAYILRLPSVRHKESRASAAFVVEVLRAVNTFGVLAGGETPHMVKAHEPMAKRQAHEPMAVAAVERSYRLA